MVKDFYKKQYFDQLNERMDTIEKKLDIISSKVTYIYGFSFGIGAVAGFIFSHLNSIINFLK